MCGKQENIKIRGTKRMKGLIKLTVKNNPVYINVDSIEYILKEENSSFSDVLKEDLSYYYISMKSGKGFYIDRTDENIEAIKEHLIKRYVVNVSIVK